METITREELKEKIELEEDFLLVATLGAEHTSAPPPRRSPVRWQPGATRTPGTTRRASPVGSTPASPTKKAANSERSDPIDTHNRNPMIPEGYEDILESTALAHVGTIGSYDEPQNDPVWFGPPAST